MRLFFVCFRKHLTLRRHSKILFSINNHGRGMMTTLNLSSRERLVQILSFCLLNFSSTMKIFSMANKAFVWPILAYQQRNVFALSELIASKDSKANATSWYNVRHPYPAFSAKYLIVCKRFNEFTVTVFHTKHVSIIRAGWFTKSLKQHDQKILKFPQAEAS